MRDSYLYSHGTRRAITSDCWAAEISAGGYRALIFDCDGTLVDSANAHLRSLQSAVRAQGYEIHHDWYHARTGLDRQSTFQEFNKKTLGPLDIAAASQHSIDHFIANSAAVLPISETTQLLDLLKGQCRMAVGTNAEIEVAQASLKACGLLHYFEHMSSVSQGLRPKPAPDIFRDAAERLGSPYSQTLVFEDLTKVLKPQ